MRQLKCNSLRSFVELMLHNEYDIKKIISEFNKNEAMLVQLVFETDHLSTTAKMSERIHSFWYGESNMCGYGKNKKYLSFSRGYGYCGKADKCECLKSKCSESSSKVSDSTRKLAKEKRKQTNMDRYGVQNSGQTYNAIVSRRMIYTDSNKVSEISRKVKETKEKIYGDPGYNNYEKAKQTVKKRYHVTHFVQSDQYANKRKEHTIHKNPNRLLMYDDDLIEEKCRLHTPSELASFMGYKTSSSVVQRLKTSGLKYKKGRGNSLFEQDVFETVSGIVSDVPVFRSDRTLLSGKEVDIYLPELKLAIECNGTYWHSQKQGKHRYYHQHKSQYCHQKYVRLLHIWEWEWSSEPEAIIEKIKKLINFNKIKNNKLSGWSKPKPYFTFDYSKVSRQYESGADIIWDEGKPIFTNK